MSLTLDAGPDGGGAADASSTQPAGDGGREEPDAAEPDPRPACASTVEHDCDTSPAACVPTDEGFECACPPGYEGSGIGDNGCNDIDECAENRHTCDQIPLTSCTNIAGGFECGACPEGFTGNAKLGEQGCVPLLQSLVLSRGLLEPAFDPEVESYSVVVKEWDDSIRFTPAVAANVMVEMNGAELAPGEVVTAPLSPGENQLELVTRYGEASRTYRVTVSRGPSRAVAIPTTELDPDDRFGWTVSLSGDGNILAVGTPHDATSKPGVNPVRDEAAPRSGAVYVFKRATSGTWTQVAYLKASNPDADDEFGAHISLSRDGSTLAVGAVSEASSSTGINSTPDNTAPLAGAVYIFTGSTGDWRQQAYLKASNAEAGDGFGGSVALSTNGNTLIVGAYEESSSTTVINGTPNNNADNAGAAYVFTRSGGNLWSQQAYLKAFNAEAHDAFGSPVVIAADGNTVAVGAKGEDSSTDGVQAPPDNAMKNSGAVYVFTRVGTAWSHSAYLKPSNNKEANFFGEALALSGDGKTLIASMGRDDSAATGVNQPVQGSAVDSGAAYIFVREENKWNQQALLKASNTGAGDFFGTALALSSTGDVAAVGALFEDARPPGQDNDDLEDSGAVYMFRRANGMWAQAAYLKSPTKIGFGNFGTRVSLSSDASTLTVGAPFEETDVDGDSAKRGVAYAF